MPPIHDADLFPTPPIISLVEDQIIKQDICLALAALRSPAIPQFDPYQTYPPSSSTLSDSFVEYEATMPPLNNLALFSPPMTVSMKLFGSHDIGEAITAHSSPDQSSAKSSSEVIMGPTTFCDDMKAAMSTHPEISDIAALNDPPKTGHSEVLVDARKTLNLSSSPRVSPNSNMEAPSRLGTTLLNPSDMIGLIPLSGDACCEVPAGVFPVMTSPSRGPAVHAWWNRQPPIAAVTVKAARNTSQALGFTPSPVLHSDLKTSAGYPLSSFAPTNPCDLPYPFVYDRSPQRQESLSSQFGGGRVLPCSHSSRSPALHLGPVNSKGGQSRIPQAEDTWSAVDVKTNAVRDSQGVLPRSPADIRFGVTGQAGNPLPKSINLVMSSSFPSQHRSSIPPRTHLASSLLYDPSGSSGASLTVPPLSVGCSARQVSIPGPSALAHPRIPANANARSTATITFKDGKEVMRFQTRSLVFELVSAELPKESTIRSVKCEKLGKGGFGSVRRHEERNGKTVTRVSAVKKGKWRDGKNKASLSHQAGRRVMSRWETKCLERVAGQEHLLQILEAWEDVKAGATFIRTDFVDGCSLPDWMEWTPSGNWENSAPVAAILYQVNQGLLELQSCGVTHADIKPDNVMARRDGWVVLVDFGLAHIGDAIERLGGTKGFIPSEARRRVGAIHGSRDVFAVGQTMQLLLNHKCWRTPLQPWETKLRNIITSCCDEDHATRLTPQRIRTDLFEACGLHGAGSEDGSRRVIERQLKKDRPLKTSALRKAWLAAKCHVRAMPFLKI
ncbi:hypothetical protein FRB98_003908 [Tulasnella sp. 332]|nr:hypothetical protein FRB98_003908 [Tulasnella sp. 332]